MAQKKENDGSGGAAQNDSMPCVVTSNQIDQARHTSTNDNWHCRNQQHLISLSFNREADVAPAAPFVMQSALHIAAASLFFVRVRFCDEFRERSVHLDIMSYEQSAVPQARPELAKFPEHMPVTVRAVVEKHVD